MKIVKITIEIFIEYVPIYGNPMSYTWNIDWIY